MCMYPRRSTPKSYASAKGVLGDLPISLKINELRRYHKVARGSVRACMTIASETRNA
jgi:hypothetical protein